MELIWAIIMVPLKVIAGWISEVTNSVPVFAELGKKQAKDDTRYIAMHISNSALSQRQQVAIGHEVAGVLRSYKLQQYKLRQLVTSVSCTDGSFQSFLENCNGEYISQLSTDQDC